MRLALLSALLALPALAQQPWQVLGAEGTQYTWLRFDSAFTITRESPMIGRISVKLPTIPPEIGQQIATLQAAVDGQAQLIGILQTNLESQGTTIQSQAQQIAALTSRVSALEANPPIPPPPTSATIRLAGDEAEVAAAPRQGRRIDYARKPLSAESHPGAKHLWPNQR